MQEIKLADRSTAKVGDRVYNYYDRYSVTIVEIDNEGWCDTLLDNGERGPLLNGERMCSMEVAIRQGWADE